MIEMKNTEQHGRVASARRGASAKQDERVDDRQSEDEKRNGSKAKLKKRNIFLTLTNRRPARISDARLVRRSPLGHI